MRVEHQIRAFEQVFNGYQGAMPLHRYLFAYFKQNKQMGSSDRRWATRYIYSYFRLGKSISTLATLERLAVADFLCNQTPSLIVEKYLPDWFDKFELELDKKIALVQQKYPAFKLTEVFAFKAPISDGIEEADFLNSFFIQPDLFIRVRGTHIQAVLNQLQAANVPFLEIGDEAIALPNGTKLEQIVSDPRLYQIQDLSSQYTGNYFKPNKYDYWWDACAASGGKSLLLHSMEPTVNLLVSDLRESSLLNLQERFQLAGIKKYQIKTMDLLQNNDQVLHDYEFDGILLDAPCSGSGTWGRTPEMLCFFEQHKVENYSKLQRSIASNVVKYLKPGKPLIYMTCSVFKAENEDVVNYLLENFDLKLEQMELVKGYHKKADSMFVARFIKQETTTSGTSV